MSLILTQENYHSLEANQEYLSHSQYLDFVNGCEAQTLAKIKGEWEEEPTAEMLVGSLLHSWNDKTIEQFKLEHPEMYKKNGEPYAKFLFVEEMIATLENDPFCMFVLDGQKEVIMTAEMFGTPWKIKIDTYTETENGRRIVDLKTTRSISELVWSAEYWTKVSFIEAYNYFIQMAIYCEVERLFKEHAEWAEPLIVAVSKEVPPDKAVISLQDPPRMKLVLGEIENNIPRILAIKRGIEKPIRCERCAYCRSTKRLNKVTHYSEIGE